MPRAEASHILVSTEAEANDLKQQIEGGAAFADLAKQHSQCPSGQQGGSLGQFGQGDMVPEFDQVIFSDLPLGQVSEPVKTQFGFHLIEVHKRM
jgi:peptidyl-prolyl cis-trans isomerase C